MTATTGGTPLPRGRSVMHVDFLAKPTPAPPPARPVSLTTQHQHVLALLADGLSNAQIADRLNIAATTAARRVSDLYVELGVNWTGEPRAAAVTVGFRRGWLS